MISAKVSQVQDLIAVYGELGARSDYALHLGLTEAGMGSKGIVASTAALSVLLQQGIGDTIRISLTPEPGGDRTQEVIVAQEILQTMGVPLVRASGGGVPRLRAHDKHGVPGARREHPGLRETADADLARDLRRGRGHAARRHGLHRQRPPARASTPISASACRGRARAPAAPVFIDGKKAVTLRGAGIAEEFQEIVADYVASRYPRRAEASDADGAEDAARPVQPPRRLARLQPPTPAPPQASVDTAALRPAGSGGIAPERVAHNRRAIAYWLLVPPRVSCWRWSCSGGSRVSTTPAFRLWTGARWSASCRPFGEEAWQALFADYKRFPEYQEINPGMTLAGFKEIFWLEYVHRLLGRIVGIAFALPFIWFLIRRAFDRPLTVKVLAIGILGGLQGLLGWYMVKSGLVDRPDVSPYRLAAHLGLAVGDLRLPDLGRARPLDGRFGRMRPSGRPMARRNLGGDRTGVPHDPFRLVRRRQRRGPRL